MILVIFFLQISNYLSGHHTIDVDLEEQSLTREQRFQEQKQRYTPTYHKLEQLKIESERKP
jgi:hypothetical protein